MSAVFDPRNHQQIPPVYAPGLMSRPGRQCSDMLHYLEQLGAGEKLKLQSVHGLFTGLPLPEDIPTWPKDRRG